MGDIDFVRRCTDNDISAWNEFLRKYSNLIYSYIHSVLRSKAKDLPIDAIKDLFQELIHSLIKDNYKKLKTFRARNGSSLATWLRVVTTNFSVDYIRRFKSRSVKLVDVDNLEEVAKDNAHSELRGRLIEEERHEQLSECIEELPVEDKCFLEFYLRKRVSLDNISQILRLSRQAADMRKSRIVQKLKECFKKRGFLLGF